MTIQFSKQPIAVLSQASFADFLSQVRTRRRREQMHKTNFAAIAAGALLLAGIAGWTTGSNRPLQDKASTAIEAQIDQELPMEECGN